jgi:hypothetical protein
MKRSSVDDELKKLQRFNVFEIKSIGISKNPIIPSNNQSMLARIQNSIEDKNTEEKKITRRGKEKLIAKKMIADANKSHAHFESLHPPTRFKQPILKKLPSAIFMHLQVSLSPIKQELALRMKNN